MPILSKRPLLVLIALFMVARILLLFKFHNVGWDESVYLGMGKFIYSGGSSGLWENLRPLGLSVLTGAFWKLNLPYVLFSELLILAFSVGSIVLTSLIGRHVFDRRTGLLSAGMLATSPFFFNYSGTILTEIPSTFFALASLLLLLRKKYFLGGALAAVAMLFKFPHGLIIVIFFVLGILSLFEKKSLRGIFPAVASSAGFAALTLPFLLFNYIVYHAYVSGFFKVITFTFSQASWHQSNPAKAIVNPFLNYTFYIVAAFKQHILFLLLLAGILLFWKRKKDANTLVLAAFALLYFGYFTWIVNKDDRFLLLFLPVLCVFAAASFFSLYNLAKLSGRRVAPALVALLILSFALSLAVDGFLAVKRPSSEPNFVSEVYRLPEKLGLTGIILVHDPTFSAYSDNLYYHYYDLSGESLLSGLKPSNPWEKRPLGAVIYSTDAIGCSTGECEQKKALLLESLKLNYREAFNRTYPWGSSYHVFVNATSSLS